MTEKHYSPVREVKKLENSMIERNNSNGTEIEPVVRVAYPRNTEVARNP